MLIECPDCKREVSDTAIKCLHCGRPIAKTTGQIISERGTEICLAPYSPVFLFLAWDGTIGRLQFLVGTIYSVLLGLLIGLPFSDESSYRELSMREQASLISIFVLIALLSKKRFQFFGVKQPMWLIVPACAAWIIILGSPISELESTQGILSILFILYWLALFTGWFYFFFGKRKF